jgi:DNA invertase Pin-like site-specific DNA recombinase
MPVYSYICNEFDFLSNNTFNQKLHEYLKQNNIEINNENKIYEIQKKQSHWIEKKISKIINKLENNDHFIIYNITHMARSAFQVYQIFSKLQHKEISLHIIDKNMTIKFTKTMETKFLLDLCEKTEESFISRRTTEAISRREHKLTKTKNQNLNPEDKKNLDENKNDIMKYLNLKVSKVAISKILSCETATLNTWLDTENKQKICQ